MAASKIRNERIGIVNENRNLSDFSYLLPVDYNEEMNLILKRGYSLNSAKAGKFSISAKTTFTLQVQNALCADVVKTVGRLLTHPCKCN